jgi:SAM-dependent methyltransferase
VETTNCNMCGSNHTELAMIGVDRLHGLNGTFRLVRCRQCGLFYLNPRPEPDELHNYYPTDYIPYTTAIEDETSFFKRLDRRYGLYKRCRVIVSCFDRPGRLLDVGCATGVFLHGMRRRGWETYGVDISSKATEYAKERFGLDVFTGTVAEAAFANNFFDVVTLWDVLEHVYDPRGTLLEISRILRPGGLLVLSLPSLESFEASLFGSNWIGWDMPRHLHLFPQPVLDRLLAETGFRPQEVSFFTGRYYVFVLSTQLWLEGRLENAKLRNVILSLMRSWPVRLLALPFYGVLDRLGKSSTMTVFARRL